MNRRIFANGNQRHPYAFISFYLADMFCWRISMQVSWLNKFGETMICIQIKYLYKKKSPSLV